jgi:hypothetical protein
VAIKTLHFARGRMPAESPVAGRGADGQPVAPPEHRADLRGGRGAGRSVSGFQYVPGKNLAEYLQTQRGLTPARAIAIMQPILDALWPTRMLRESSIVT